MKSTSLILLAAALLMASTAFSSASVEKTPVAVAAAPEAVENGPVVRWTLTAILNHFKVTPEIVVRIQDVVAKADEVFLKPLSKLDVKQFEAFQVAAPAPGSAYTEVINELQAEVKSLKQDNEELFKRLAAVEARKECTCPKVVAAPAAPPKAPAPVTYRQECQNGVCRLVPVTQVQQPATTYYEGGCANGQCSSGGFRGFFRRGR